MQLFGKPKSKHKMDGLISNSTDIVGDVKFKGGFRVEGKVKGNIISDNDPDSILVIAETATVEGDIFASNLIINGKVTGQISATKLAQLESRANVEGDIAYAEISMLAGAIVNGSLIHKVDNSNTTLYQLEKAAA